MSRTGAYSRTTATAQSVHDKQLNFMAKAGELARKPEEEITKADAAELQRMEVIYQVIPLKACVY